MEPRVVISRRLAGRPGLICLGPRPSLAGYRPDEMELIRQARIVYYPTRLLASPLKALGKSTYPSWESHYFGQDKLRQFNLFSLAGLPLPRTKVYFGRQRGDILNDFQFPFVAKRPRASALGRGVFLIRDRTELEAYLLENKVAYIQEYLAEADDHRVVIAGGRLLTAYRRIAQHGGFRANLAQGGRPSFDKVDPAAVELGLRAAAACNLDETGLDILVTHGQAYLIEANLLFGRQALRLAGLDFKDLVHQMIISGEIEERLRREAGPPLYG